MSTYSEQSAYYADFGTGYWAKEEAEACPCKGHGWALSEVDTWHTCPVHFNGQRHPEDDHDEEAEAEVVVPLCPGTELRGDPEKGMRMVSAPTTFVDENNLVQRGEPEDDDLLF